MRDSLLYSVFLVVSIIFDVQPVRMIRIIVPSALRYLGVPLALLCLPAYFWLGKHPSILATKAMSLGS